MILHIAQLWKFQFAFLAVKHLVHAVGVLIAFLDHDVVTLVNDDSFRLAFFFDLEGVLFQAVRFITSRLIIRSLSLSR